MNNYPFLPANSSLSENFLKKIVLTVNLLMNGKINNTGEVTLTPGATSTTVENNLVNENSVILLEAITHDAATHVSNVYIVAGDKSFVIHHNSNPSTTRTHRYVVIG